MFHAFIQVANPFEPCDVSILKNFGEIKTKDIQTLALNYLGKYHQNQYLLFNINNTNFQILRPQSTSAAKFTM